LATCFSIVKQVVSFFLFFGLADSSGNITLVQLMKWNSNL
jgi:hypothetical protein